MPQLDLTIIFPQIFWFFTFFISLYYIILTFFLPKFLLFIKFRKNILLFYNNKIYKLNLNFNKSKNLIINNSLNKLRSLKQNFLIDTIYLDKIFILNSKNISLNSLNKITFNSLKNNIIYCNKFLLNSIFVYPSILNLKK